MTGLDKADAGEGEGLETTDIKYGRIVVLELALSGLRATLVKTPATEPNVCEEYMQSCSPVCVLISTNSLGALGLALVLGWSPSGFGLKPPASPTPCPERQIALEYHKDILGHQGSTGLPQWNRCTKQKVPTMWLLGAGACVSLIPDCAGACV